MFKVGLRRAPYQDVNRSNWEGTGPRPLLTDMWYPAKDAAIETDVLIGPPGLPFFKAGKAARDAEILDGSFPLILLSHGTGGTSLQWGWLASYLASRGYIAAAVNHHGNNGLEPYTAQGFSRYWERAKDLTVLLDQLLADPIWGLKINLKQIGAAGFSLGGYTVIAVAGGRTNIEPMLRAFEHGQLDLHNVIPPEFQDYDSFVNEFKSLADFVPLANTSYKDERIRSIFALAPVLGESFSADGLSSIQIPVKIVVGDSDQLAPANVNASHYATHIRSAELNILENVGHYTFLAEATELGKHELPMFCLDADGVDRENIHQMVSEWVKDYFESTLDIDK